VETVKKPFQPASWKINKSANSYRALSLASTLAWRAVLSYSAIIRFAARINTTIVASSYKANPFDESPKGERTEFNALAVARIAIIGNFTARIAVRCFIARIASGFDRKEATKPLSKRESVTVVKITTICLTAWVTRNLVARRASNYSFRTAIGSSVAWCTIFHEFFETCKKVTRLVSVAARINGFTRIAITCINPSAHQKGDDQRCHHNPEFH
jgi:hypothetical protein